MVRPGVLAALAAAWPAERWRDVHVLVAVSGGADSMALLRAMLAAKMEAGGRGRLFAGHINHGLRAEESDADEAWLHEQCADLGVPLRVERADVKAVAIEQGDGIEAAARTSRYRLLREIAERTGCRFLAVAHTADDQVETVLFRLLRGSGLRGLAGIPQSRPLSPSVTLVRPLLECQRSAVLAYLEAVRQPYRHDRSNEALHFVRNRIRGELLPYLRENFGDDVDAAIGRFASLAAEAEDVIEYVAAEVLARCRTALERPSAPGEGFALEVAPLQGQPPLLVAEVLRTAWREAGLSEQAMTRQWWRKLAEFAVASPPTSALNLPGDLRAERSSAGVLAVTAANRLY